MAVKICDSMTGSGKTSAAIKFMTNNDGPFIYITPYKEEYHRIIECCPSKWFCTPGRYPSKLDNMIPLLRDQRNIASTHVLFSSYTPEIVRLIREGHYTLIMDEAFEVISQDETTADDIKELLRKNAIAIDPETYQVRWLDDGYEGSSFRDFMLRAKSGTLLYYEEKFLFWMFPIEVFNAFDDVIVMTYMFEAQNQRYYFELNHVKYSYIGIKKLGDLDYEFCSVEEETPYTLPLNRMITIFDRKKQNALGTPDTSDFKKQKSSTMLSSRDLKKAKKAKKELFSSAGKNIYNVFHNYYQAPPGTTMWSVLKNSQELIDTRRYKDDFVECTARATNKYSDRDSLAYIRNIFMNPFLKNYYKEHGCKINEDQYALSELIQWVWRSAIRNGKPIRIYLPSSRMRILFQEWIDAISNGREVRERKPNISENE